MSKQDDERSMTFVTNEHPRRFSWHVGKVFGDELCVRMEGIPGSTFFRQESWRIVLFFKKCGPVFLEGQDAIPFDIYPKGDLAKMGKPE